MIEIKLEKEFAGSRGIFIFWPQNHHAIFKHCTNGASSINISEVEEYSPIFNVHGYQLVFPITCEDTGVLWRVSDGVEFRKNENGKYYMVESEMHRPYEYDFEVLNDGYNFTSEKGEIKK